GGEEVSWGDVAESRKRFGDRCVFVNGYGTTEVSFIAQHHIGPDDPHGPGGASGARVPVGHPLAGIEVDLVDSAGNADGDLGEVVVRSPHVALGYWGRPDLTAERFVEGSTVDGRGYRTGDLARRLPDGRLVYAGRVDRQVKVRGFRVEPGEIEARLAARPDVAHVAVAPHRGELMAFVVPAAGVVLDAEELRRDLGTELPDYLVPRTVVLFRDPPLTSTGKVDVRALLDGHVDRVPAPARDPEPAGDAAPGTPLMETITAAWREVLGVPDVGPDARFFELGGHSLMMALVHQRLQQGLGRKIPLAWMFQHPTVSSLARRLEAAGTDGAALDRVSDRMSRRRSARAGRGTP
ncbi:non-ribosomal peptide synthetase, partial [Virgisporangium aurantiacum]|uniref:non-ribosomal peptide synthetase n=1 Tax=Virgisporangium aurantiacum TaxID=175570 RepID=UPI0019508C07